MRWPQLTVAERFWSKVDRNGPIHPALGTRCWLWTDRLVRGYGRISLGSKSEGEVYAHRYSLELQYGPVPKNKKVCHSCDNPQCVNPDHLFLGTQLANIRDMIGKKRDRNPASVNRGRTHCKHGHPLSGGNLETRTERGKTTRGCRTCHVARAAESKRRRRQEHPA